ncbi:MAG: IS110 family transposase [Zavarzinella sp.]|nr:IS110 family transposase [Zavarzinella sp.]
MDLTQIDGIDVGTALAVLAEIGVDVTRFPTEKHFASWLGLCPRQHESNRAKKKRTPRRGKNRVAMALGMAAQGLGRTQSPLGLFYRRVKGRIAGKGAVTAAAHKLACLVYRMLRYGTEYVRRSLAEYEQKVRAQVERALRRKAAALGYELVRAAGPGAAKANRAAGPPARTRTARRQTPAERILPPDQTTRPTAEVASQEKTCGLS